MLDRVVGAVGVLFWASLGLLLVFVMVLLCVGMLRAIARMW